MNTVVYCKLLCFQYFKVLLLSCVFHTSRAPKIHNLFFVYREFIEEINDELLHEPSGEFDNFFE